MPRWPIIAPAKAGVADMAHDIENAEDLVLIEQARKERQTISWADLRRKILAEMPREIEPGGNLKPLEGHGG